jgi:putative ABC transport system ATP-binding protein
MIELKNVKKKYVMGETIVMALNGIDISISEGEFVSIVGPSGSGKSTLMNVIGCLDVVSEGDYVLNQIPIKDYGQDALADIRNRQIGFIFQQFNLLPSFTALENVMIPMTYAKMPKAQREQKALELLTLVGLGDRVHHKPTELSGGQQQRVSIARALSNDPAIILADEPTGALDSQTGLDVLKQLRKLNETGKTVVIITHDLDIAEMTDRKIILKDGKVASDEKVKHPKKVSA